MFRVWQSSLQPMIRITVWAGFTWWTAALQQSEGFIAARSSKVCRSPRTDPSQPRELSQ
jgi:hypothetical protein